jgi:IclR family transcriptional regulator, pca regulon regulatory protein
MLGIADIVGQLGMTRSTTHRYVITLVALGYLEQPSSAGRKYRLGLRVSDLGLVALNMLRVRAQSHPHLQELRQQVYYTVSVAVLENDEVLIVNTLPGFRGHARMGLNVGVSSRLPAYCTSMGKVLLAHLPDMECRAILRGLTLAKRGPNTIRQKHLLSRELLQVHEAGFAINDEELAAGVHSIAMPVRAENEEVVAAASIAAPTSMVPHTQLIEEFGPRLVSTADRISACLGYTLDDEQAGN